MVQPVVWLPVADMHVRLPFNVIWKKNNSSSLLQKFVAQVEAEKPPREIEQRHSAAPDAGPDSLGRLKRAAEQRPIPSSK
jgi:hypothetical protein